MKKTKQIVPVVVPPIKPKLPSMGCVNKPGCNSEIIKYVLPYL